MAQDTETLITDAMRDTVGKDGPPVTLDVDKSSIRMFARAVGHVDQLFYNEDYARSKGHRGLVAPPGYFGTPVYMPGEAPSAGMAGTEAADGRRLRSLNGGSEFDFPAIDVCAGDTITAVTRVISVTQRDTSLGPMVIMRRETTYTNQLAEVVGRAYGTALMY